MANLYWNAAITSQGYRAVPLPTPLERERTVARRTPVVVGGMGGSGTRVVAALMQELGAMLTSDVASMDCHCIPHLKKAVVGPILDVVHRANYELGELGFELKRSVVKTVQEGLSKYVIKLRERNSRARGNLDEQLWGFKEPSSYYLLPFWKEIFPGSVFIHVVRDGRDMAYSSNHMQSLSLYEHLFDRSGGDRPTTSIKEGNVTAADRFDQMRWDSQKHLALMNARIWNKVNLEVHLLGQELKRKGWDGYHLLRIEDLVKGGVRGVQDVTSIVRKVGIQLNSLQIRNAIYSAISKPLQPHALNATAKERYGRWKEQDATDSAFFKILSKEMQQGLETFQYF